VNGLLSPGPGPCPGLTDYPFSHCLALHVKLRSFVRARQCSTCDFASHRALQLITETFHESFRIHLACESIRRAGTEQKGSVPAKSKHRLLASQAASAILERPPSRISEYAADPPRERSTRRTSQAAWATWPGDAAALPPASGAAGAIEAPRVCGAAIRLATGHDARHCARLC